MLFVGGYKEYDAVKDHGRWFPGLSFWGCLLYAVICVSMINFMLETWAIRRSSVTAASVFTTLDFPNTAWMSKLILDERLTLGVVLGGIVIITGILLTISSSTVSHDEEADTNVPVEKKPLLASE